MDRREGRSKQKIDYKEYQISGNSLFFISPNQVHQFEEWQKIVGGSIMFTEDDTQDDGRNGHLTSGNFLDAAQFPTIDFKSTKIEISEANKYRMHGDLTMTGVSKPV